MQRVVNSFDLVMGFGAAVPYTALAQKAMSRHFRCLKDAIAAQIRQLCELLGDKDGGAAAGGITRGETPRLKALEKSLRQQQRAFHFHQMEQEDAWRPQRGLPERSVSILRAWLFEHFLHPYPSDADKHLLARQTGLSRNQVSNWFINARVRLWKPMIEEMYQQESKEDDDDDNVADASQDEEKLHTTTQSPAPIITPTSAAAATTTPPAVKRSPEIPDENDVVPPSSSPLAALINRQQQYFSDSQHAAAMIVPSSAVEAAPPPSPPLFHEYANYGTGGTSMCGDQDNFGPTDVAANTLIRYGTAAGGGGDVSLTLGLRHVGNVPEKASSTFSIRDFGDC
ncbi:unnamed protein product [Linum tenue]|nr:unnamed protein product [Linum tenue]